MNKTKRIIKNNFKYMNKWENINETKKDSFCISTTYKKEIMDTRIFVSDIFEEKDNKIAEIKKEQTSKAPN